MQVWPLAVLTIGLTIGLGLAIARLQKNEIMKNWKEKRCGIPVMTVASYFKPSDDPRTNSQFASDNFTFCMKEAVETAYSIAMTPYYKILESQASAASSMTSALDSAKAVIANIYKGFTDYIESFFGKYYNITFQIGRIAEHFKMAFQRVGAIVLSMVFTGISMVRGMLNTMDLFFKVAVIVLGIIVALLFILFFVLFPFIPFILSLITALMAVAVGSTAGALDSYRESFCFAPGTQIKMADCTIKPIQNVKNGDILFGNSGVVEANMVLSGAKTPLYMLNGILVSGSHLVSSSNNTWHSVSEDPRAKITSTVYQRLYCLNTSGRSIPIIDITGNIILFKDWEELDQEDFTGEYGWGYHVLSMLNKYKNYELWKDSLSTGCEMPCISPNSYVMRKDTTLIKLSDVKIGDIIADKNGFTEVLGILECGTNISGEKNHLISGNKQWYSNLLIFDQALSIWKRNEGTKTINGYGKMLFTESGTFYLVSNNETILVRDFTEVGHKQIHRTYPYVATRINALRPINNLSKKTEL